MKKKLRLIGLPLLAFVLGLCLFVALGNQANDRPWPFTYWIARQCNEHGFGLDWANQVALRERLYQAEQWSKRIALDMGARVQSHEDLVRHYRERLEGAERNQREASIALEQVWRLLEAAARILVNPCLYKQDDWDCIWFVQRPPHLSPYRPTSDRP